MGVKSMPAFIRYTGSKNTIAPIIARVIRSTGGTCLVDLFGGSAAVLLKSGYDKRIYNDANGDLVNLFRVMANREQRRELLFCLKNLPLSRKIFDDDHEAYRAAGKSFCRTADPVERARQTFYRHALCFGGKIPDGGFQTSCGSTKTIKELSKYRATLRSFHEFGQFFRDTIMEHLDFAECIKKYHTRKQVVIFADPPYPEVQEYYAHPFCIADHVYLAEQLTSCQCPVVATFYENDTVRELYPESRWVYKRVTAPRNSSDLRKVKERKHTELILTKRTQ